MPAISGRVLQINEESKKAMIMINGRIFSLVAFLLTFQSYVVWSQETRDTLHLTLDQALAIALSESPTIRIADQEIEKQGYAKQGTYAALFPQIDIQGAYQRAIRKPAAMPLPGVEGGLSVGRNNTYSAGFMATMPLIAPPLWKGVQISAHEVELSIEKARSSRIEMTNQVKCAFYSVLLAQDALNVFNQAYDNAVFNYSEIERKYRQGLLAEYDLIRAGVNVKNAEPNVYDAENSLILAHWQLKALLGLDLESNVACVGSLSGFEERLVEDYLQTDLTLNGNSDLRQIDIQHRQLQKTRQMQIAQYYPTLGVQWKHQWTSASNNFRFKDYKWAPQSAVALSLTVPVFSGGKRFAEVKKTQLAIHQLTDRRLDVERNLNVAAKQHNDRMATCIKQYQAASAGVEQALKSYDITMKRYETGEGTMLDINDAQLSLTQAQLNMNQSVYNYLVAKSELEKTLGSTYMPERTE
jgi:outer membrane protein TolC